MGHHTKNTGRELTENQKHSAVPMTEPREYERVGRGNGRYMLRRVNQKSSFSSDSKQSSSIVKPKGKPSGISTDHVISGSAEDFLNRFIALAKVIATSSSKLNTGKPSSTEKPVSAEVVNIKSNIVVEDIIVHQSGHFARKTKSCAKKSNLSNKSKVVKQKSKVTVDALHLLLQDHQDEPINEKIKKESPRLRNRKRELNVLSIGGQTTVKSRGMKRKSDVSVEALYLQKDVNNNKTVSAGLVTIHERREIATFGHKRRRITVFGEPHAASKQKLRYREVRASRLKRRGVKVPTGKMFTQQDVASALSHISDEEDDMYNYLIQ
ncbi:unnamed protein product [Meganyctiphanes norvegica]|uniref:Tantalus-like domain-containing protein n=1 Tax=Meganyctiphanes norvegica TaxID=48144 RepID=A0AAV2RIN6_MEGNR